MGSIKIKRNFLILLFLFDLVQLTNGQSVNITGTIKDMKGFPVSNASIQIKNTNTGTRTDTLGHFMINTNPAAILLVSAVGYRDTSASVENQTHLTIFLSASQKTLNEVLVSAPAQNSAIPSPERISNEQIISGALSDFVKGADINYGITQRSGIRDAPAGAIQTKGGGWHIATTGVLNTVNNGTLIPVFTHREETKGSRYLFDKFAKGLVINQFDTIINNPAYLYNYDKLAGILLMTEDRQNYIEVDKPQIKSFALKSEEAAYIFERVPSLKPDKFFVLLTKGTQFALYKLIKTKFIKANYQTNGLTESGHSYDEYLDDAEYYLVNEKNHLVKQFEIKKKSIREAFGSEKAKTDKYFIEHGNEDINEAFIKNLTAYLNQ